MPGHTVPQLLDGGRQQAYPCVLVRHRNQLGAGDVEPLSQQQVKLLELFVAETWETRLGPPGHWAMSIVPGAGASTGTGTTSGSVWRNGQSFCKSSSE